MIEVKGKQARDLPGWVVTGLVVVCIACAGGFVYWTWTGGNPGDREIVILEPPGASIKHSSNPKKARPEAPVAAVRKTGFSTWLARGGDAQCAATVSKKGTVTSLTWSYWKTDAFPQEQIVFLSGVSRWIKVDPPTTRPTTAPAAGATPHPTAQQIEAIRKIGRTLEMKVSEGDNKAVMEAWNAYFVAPEDGKAEFEKKLVSAIGETGKKSLEPSRQLLAERVGKIQATLTTDQLDHIKGATK